RRTDAPLGEQLRYLPALHHPSRRIRGEPADQHPGDARLQCVEILLVLPVRAAVVERQHGDARSGILAAALGAQLACDRAKHNERQQCRNETRAHRISSSDQRVSVIPSCAATTSAGRPLVRAWRRAAATSASIASSPCSGSWWNSTKRFTPASPASTTASSKVEWPHPRCSPSSPGVYIASWISSSTPSRNVTKSLRHDAGVS